MPSSRPATAVAGRLADDLGVDDAALGLGEDLGLTDLDARLRGDDADAGVAVGVHEAQRDDPVEPGVGDLVGDGSAALVAAARGGDRLLQGGDGLRLLDSLGGRRRQHRGDARGDLADERGARPGGEGLQRCGFHQSEIRFPSFRVWTSALRRAARYLSTSCLGLEHAGRAGHRDGLHRDGLLRRRRVVVAARLAGEAASRSSRLG